MKSIIAILKAYGVFRKLIIAVVLLICVFLTGVGGFMWIENYSFLDAAYMTILTVASVGFSEVHPLSEGGKLFTSLLIVMSVATYVYAITVVTSFIIEGEFRMHFKHLQLNTEITKLRDHVIVCGYGRNGKQACQQLESGNVRYVVVENNQHIIEGFRDSNSILFVEGNATEDDVLKNAGIDRAKGLIAALPDDAANVFVVLTAREMNPSLKIISRASNDASENKLKRAGADNVIMPDKIGGTHMAALITKPDVLEFLDYMTGRIDVRLEEVHFNQLPASLQNKSIREICMKTHVGANVIGMRKANGEYMVNPPLDTAIVEGSKLFVLGTQEQASNFLRALSQ